jgi:hypothetical protein
VARPPEPLLNGREPGRRRLASRLLRQELLDRREQVGLGGIELERPHELVRSAFAVGMGVRPARRIGRRQVEAPEQPFDEGLGLRLAHRLDRREGVLEAAGEPVDLGEERPRSRIERVRAQQR